VTFSEAEEQLLYTLLEPYWKTTAAFLKNPQTIGIHALRWHLKQKEKIVKFRALKEGVEYQFTKDELKWICAKLVKHIPEVEITFAQINSSLPGEVQRINEDYRRMPFGHPQRKKYEYVPLDTIWKPREMEKLATLVYGQMTEDERPLLVKFMRDMLARFRQEAQNQPKD